MSKEQVLSDIEKIDSQISLVSSRLSKLLEEEKKSIKYPSAPAQPIYRIPQEIPGFAEQQQTHESLKPFLIKYIMGQKEAAEMFEQALAQEWTELRKIWKKRMAEIVMPMESAEELQKRNLYGRPEMESRANWNDHRMSIGKSLERPRLGMADAVRSEEELHQVLLNLIEQERANPDVRWKNTLADIPPMEVDSASMAHPFYDTNNLVEDANALMQSSMKSRFWTEKEKSTFIAKFIQYPKKFHKISSFLENKSTKDCVKFYYEIKKTVNLKKMMKMQGAAGMKKKMKKIISEGSVNENVTVGERRKKPSRSSTPLINQQQMASQSTPSTPPSKAELKKWSVEERRMFALYFPFCGTNWNLMAQYVEGKTVEELKNYYALNRDRLSFSTPQEGTEEAMDVDMGYDDNEEVEEEEAKKKRRKKKEFEEKKVKASPKSSAAPIPSSSSREGEKPVVPEGWKHKERQLFATYYPYTGKNWTLLARYIPTKNASAIRNFFKNYFRFLTKEEMLVEESINQLEPDPSSEEEQEEEEEDVEDEKKLPERQRRPSLAPLGDIITNTQLNIAPLNEEDSEATPHE